MDDPRLTLGEALFRHALDIIDEAARAGHRLGDWTFGGGTVLMRRYHHRVSKDVDIFVPDPQWLGYLTPRLNPAAEEKTGEYVEQAGFLKLYFPQGELDFVVAAPLTPSPWLPEPIMGRRIRVESSAESMAKKLKHRGAELKARDLFDLAVVIEREPKCLPILAPILAEQKSVVLQRLVAAKRRCARTSPNSIRLARPRPTTSASRECARYSSRPANLLERSVPSDGERSRTHG